MTSANCRNLTGSRLGLLELSAMDIMCGLPNDLIMNIIQIRCAEDRHNALWSKVMDDFKRNGIYMLPCPYAVEHRPRFTRYSIPLAERF